jgi:hypothetical protein
MARALWAWTILFHRAFVNVVVGAGPGQIGRLDSHIALTFVPHTKHPMPGFMSSVHERGAEPVALGSPPQLVQQHIQVEAQFAAQSTIGET